MKMSYLEATMETSIAGEFQGRQEKKDGTI